MLKNILVLHLILFLGFSIFSCSSNPSASKAKKELAEKIKNESDGNFELVSFTKTNAVERNIFGQKLYFLQYDAMIKVNNDCYFQYSPMLGLGTHTNFKTYTSKPDNLLLVKTVKYNKGDEIKFSGELEYHDTENGWVRN